jgi:hypothetical protein
VHLEAETTQNSWLQRLRQVFAGFTRDPAAGGCPGDPSVWERDMADRARAGEQSATIGDSVDSLAQAAPRSNRPVPLPRDRPITDR